VVAAALLALLALGACGGGAGDVADGLPGEPNAEVVRVVDGDTVVVRTGGVEESVRLIGIDTPETVKPGTPVECYGEAASARAKELLPEGTQVVLERDVEARDRYDRLLAYVHRASDGLFVNLSMVEDGYAQPAPYPPNEAHADELAEAGREAQAADLGLWGECGGDDLYG
jgi:micrococcal nuclease